MVSHPARLKCTHASANITYNTHDIQRNTRPVNPPVILIPKQRLQNPPLHHVITVLSVPISARPTAAQYTTVQRADFPANLFSSLLMILDKYFLTPKNVN